MNAEPSILAPAPPAEAPSFRAGLDGIRARVDGALAELMASKRRQAAESAGEAFKLVDAVATLARAGGKRLRPALVYHAFRACGGEENERVLPLALSTELLHTYLLLHDDIMDHARTRRGLPAAHVTFARQHAAAGFRGDGDDFGRTMAILAGDLAASYSNEQFVQATAGARRQAELEAVYSAMCQEVIHGQYLEIVASYLDQPPAADLERVLRLKSGRYSVERPIELGALLADVDQDRLRALRGYGAALGEAFQLQDDLLGLFGQAETTGKPVGGDLAEGKFTFLLHHALAATTGEDRALLERVRGRRDASPDELARAVAVIEASGARDAVRAMISTRLETARASLAALELRAEGAAFLEGLIAYSEEREE